MERPFFENKSACCFTGHRPDGLPGEDTGAMTLIRLRLIRTVQEAVAAGVTSFLCGGAEGFDTIAAEAVIAAREDYPAVRLILALPSRSFLLHRGMSERLRADGILRAASEAVYASDDDNSALAMMTRNRYLVDHADCCVAYLRKSRGGTFYTVNYAMDRGIPVKNLAIDSFS